jgi:hypothetical protein
MGEAEGEIANLVGYRAVWIVAFMMTCVYGFQMLMV